MASNSEKAKSPQTPKMTKSSTWNWIIGAQSDPFVRPKPEKEATPPRRKKDALDRLAWIASSGPTPRKKIERNIEQMKERWQTKHSPKPVESSASPEPSGEKGPAEIATGSPKPRSSARTHSKTASATKAPSAAKSASAANSNMIGLGALMPGDSYSNASRHRHKPNSAAEARPDPETLAEKPENRYKFTQEEDEQLIAMKREGKTWKEIAPALKRPEGNCKHRFNKELKPVGFNAQQPSKKDKKGKKAKADEGGAGAANANDANGANDAFGFGDGVQEVTPNDQWATAGDVNNQWGSAGNNDNAGANAIGWDADGNFAGQDDWASPAVADAGNNDSFEAQPVFGFGAADEGWKAQSNAGGSKGHGSKSRKSEKAKSQSAHASKANDNDLGMAWGGGWENNDANDPFAAAEYGFGGSAHKSGSKASKAKESVQFGTTWTTSNWSTRANNGRATPDAKIDPFAGAESRASGRKSNHSKGKEGAGTGK